MPRDSSGTYSLPAGNPVRSGEIIAAGWANVTMDDLGESLSASLDRYGRGGMLAPFQFTDGTESAPGATWANEPTTGLYRNAYADLRMSITGADKQRWTSSSSFLWRNGQWEEILTQAGSGGDTTINNLVVTGSFTSPGIDDNANATAITINSSENVGVGNPDPISKFDVYQTDPTKEISRLRLWGDANNPMLIVSGDEADHSIDFRATGSTSGCDLSFTTSGFERMRISDLGHVGITGDVTVTGSNKQITIDDTGTNGVQAYMSAGSNTGGFVASRGAPNDSEVRLEAKGNVGSLKMTGLSGLSTEIQSNSGGNLVFNMSGTQRALLTQAGTFSAEKLVANNNVTVESTYPSIDLIDTDATLGLGTRVVTSSDSFLISALNSAGSYVQDIYKVNMNANGPTLHSWTTESAGTAMALSNGGTLGLGTTVPDSNSLMELQANASNGKSGASLLKLTNTESAVASMTFNTTGNNYSIGSSGSNIFNVYDITNASTPFAIDPNTPSSTLRLSSAGRVGIGTSSPAYTLEVEDSPTTTGAPQVAISAGASDVDGVLAFPLAGSSKGSIISNKPLTFHTGTTVNTANERMRIDNSGNVGIGTDAPQRPLHVNDVMRLEPRATVPSNPSAGDIYFASNTGQDGGVLRCYDGFAWQNCF